jgi:pyruvate dehydrogenase E1 component alpha subunit
MRGSDQVILCFFGDGAANMGPFHESMNMAAIWKLPVVYVCENNQYAMSYSVRKAFAIERISDRAAAYGMPGETVDGNDVLAVHQAVEKAAARARAGEGPTLIENVTYRWRGHSRSDVNRYRTREEIDAWKEKCPIVDFCDLLIEDGVLTEEEAEGIEKEAYAAVDAAVEFSESSPWPEIDTIEEGVYA